MEMLSHVHNDYSVFFILWMFRTFIAVYRILLQKGNLRHTFYLLFANCRHTGQVSLILSHQALQLYHVEELAFFSTVCNSCCADGYSVF